MDLTEPTTWAGFDDAVIGRAMVWDQAGHQLERLVYSGERMLAIMGGDRDGALEYLLYNIEDAYVGPDTPIIVW